MGASNSTTEELKSDFDQPGTNGKNKTRANTARGGYDFEEQHRSMSPFMQERNEGQNKPKLISSTAGRIQKSSDSQEIHNNLVSELKDVQKMRKNPISRPKISDSLYVQPKFTIPQFNERLVAPTFRNSELKSNNGKNEPDIIGDNLPRQLSKAPIPPPRIRPNNSESLGNKNSGQQRNSVVKNQRGNEVQPHYISENNASAGGTKIDSQQHLNNETEPKTSDSLSEKCYDPKDATLRFVNDEDSLDFQLKGFKSLRALMSCGHAVTPMSLINYCHWLLEKGVTRFVCGAPDCDHEWPVEEVCKMALLTPEEIDHFEKKMFDIKKNSFDIKSCPGCNSQVLRSNLSSLCVECTVCTADKKRRFLFCWQCLREWRGPSSRSDHCDNEDCNNEALGILKNCPEITFKVVKGVVGCPSIRACPCCGLLVGHNSTKCKYMTCARCKNAFCFVCLKLEIDCLDSLNSFYGPCSNGVAPRQTSIPLPKI